MPTPFEYLGNSSDTESFTMDDLGNRSSVDLRGGSSETYAVNDETNRYDEATGGPYDVTLSYDDAGSVTTDADGYDYFYDYENRILRIEEDNGGTPTLVAGYMYDALGRRMLMINSTATFYYYNDKWQVLNEHNGVSFSNRYVYGNYIDEVLTMNNGTADYYYAHNHLYSPTALIDYDGDVVERYEYNAYGKMTRLDPDFTTWSGTEAGNPYYFTGRANASNYFVIQGIVYGSPITSV